MIDKAFRDHGGALDVAMAAFGGDRADWLDLSTGINPLPPRLPNLSLDVWARLPDRSAEHRLIEAARTAYGAPPAAGITAAPGSQALISTLPLLFDPTVVAVLDPTYSEHGKAFAAAGHDVRTFQGLGTIPPEARIVVVVNPNNPDGRRFAPADLLPLASRLAEANGQLVVDEAFADPEPELSLAPHTGRDGLLVHRSFGKFFGLAGLRLGFALTSDALAARLSERLGPWAVSGPALSIGATFLEDVALHAGLKRRLSAQSERLLGVLSRSGFDIVGRTALFATIRHPAALQLHEALCRRQILSRPFAYAPDWLRYGNPATEAEARRLERALGESLAETKLPQDDVARHSV